MKMLIFPWIAILLSAGCVFQNHIMSKLSGEIPVESNAAYLEFEHGFMVYWAAETCLYAYAYDANIIIPDAVDAQKPGSYDYCLPFDDLPDAETELPPGMFGRVWAYYSEVREALGSPVGEVIEYTAFMPPSDPPASGAPWVSPIIMLPDRSELHCGFRAATAGYCDWRIS